MFYFNMEPRLKWNTNVLAWVTNGSGLDVDTEPRLNYYYYIRLMAFLG